MRNDWALAASLLVLTACAAHRMTMTLDVLGGIPVGTDRESSAAAAALSRLRVSFDQASAEYDAGKYRAAAELFMTAAHDARGDAGSYTRSALADSRCACYRNAARSWAMAGVLDKERVRLERAALEDPSCQKDIARILELLGATTP